MEEPSTLPQTNEPISRPSPTSTLVSANLQQLPAISALAVSNAAQSPPQLRYDPFLNVIREENRNGMCQGIPASWSRPSQEVLRTGAEV
ncbi:hypothetical protein E5D57_011508 [Metarhizium anisopliae]|nr:hypothetical protein E5D57_011508 [Metarhizium anisopliae]